MSPPPFFCPPLTPPVRSRSATIPSDILARVETFEKKASELFDKGHILRAAENYGRAAAAARALGVDNLVALQMELLQGMSVGSYIGGAPRGTDRLILAAHRAEYIGLIASAVAALERRRMACTLLEGKCAAVEEAWFARQLQSRNAHWPAAKIASWSALVGYAAFMRAAKNASCVLSCARVFAAECSDAQLESFAQHAVHAAELMQQPRRHGDSAPGTEAEFARALREAVSMAGAHGLATRLVQLLAEAWQRLQRSGVLQARRIEENLRLQEAEQHALSTAIQKSLTAPDLRRCALPGCGAHEAHPAHFKSCAACRAVVYCCREHQVEAWPGHKKACKAASKAAAAEDEAGPSGA